jgi:hypothetical protein
MLQVEIGLNFLVGFWNDDGEYIDSPAAVAQHYAGSIFRFWFDITTSVPFSFIDYQVAMVSHCTSPLANNVPANVPQVNLTATHL